MPRVVGPATIRELFAELDLRLSEDEKRAISEPGGDPTSQHFGFGLYLRNEFLYPGGGALLACRLRDACFPFHEDDMSAALTDLYRAHLAGKTVDVVRLRRYLGVRPDYRFDDKAKLRAALLTLLG